MSLPSVLVVAKSSNAKLGPIPATYSSRRTCPDACPLRDGPCYAEAGFRTRLAWDRADGRGNQTNVHSWDSFLNWAESLPDGQRWRKNTGGDLPGERDRLRMGACYDFAHSAAHTDPIIFTHYPILASDVRSASGEEAEAIASHNRAVLRGMAELGVTVNVSANSPEHAGRIRSAFPEFPVSIVADLPDGERHTLTLSSGDKAVTCPATHKGSTVTCADCGLCASKAAAVRKVSILFPAHGTGAKKARVIVRRSASST